MGVLEVNGVNVEHSFIKPKNFNGKAVFFVPGVSGGALSTRFDFLFKPFLENGYAVIRADLWKSAKEFLQLSVEEVFLLFDNMILFLKKEGCKEISAVGKSLGGGLLLLYANPEIREMYLFAPAIGLADSTKPEMLKKKFVEFHSIAAIRIGTKNLGGIKSKIYFFQGNKDATVSVDDAKKLASYLKNCEFLLLEGATHSYKASVEQNMIGIYLHKLLGS